MFDTPLADYDHELYRTLYANCCISGTMNAYRPNLPIGEARESIICA